MFLTITAIYAKGQESIQLSDLVGKWKLTKIEEVQMQGDAELSRQEYIPSSYIGKVVFEEMECFSDEHLIFSGKYDSMLGDRGNIQFNPNSNKIAIHGVKMSFFYQFSWVEKPDSFYLLQIATENQQNQAMIEKTILYYYEKY